MTPRRARPDRGQATVELALLLPVLVLLLLAIVQVALLGRDVVLVTHATREAARAAAVDADPVAALAAARAAGGLDDDRLRVTVTGRRPGGRVQVTVTYRARTAVPIVGAVLGDPTIRTTATMRVEPPRTSRSTAAIAVLAMGDPDPPPDPGLAQRDGGRPSRIVASRSRAAPLSR